jgi:hypothetical protein
MSVFRRTALIATVATPLFVGCGSEHASSSDAEAVLARSSSLRVLADAARATSFRKGKLDPPKSSGRHTSAESKRSRGHDAQPSAPQIRSDGGPVLSNPRIVPVFYPDDPMISQKEAFLAKLAPSAYWKATTSEYGVGPATITAPVVQPAPAPATLTDDQIHTWLKQNLEAPGSPFPAPSGQEIYTLFFPPQTAVLLPDGNGGTWTGCQQFGSYHGAVTLPSGKSAAFAVVLSCNGYLDNLVGIDSITDAASHELIEAATDPYSTIGSAAYIDANWEASGWAYTAEGYGSAELGDICEFQPAVSVMNPELGFVVQRSWSNAAAAAGHDPCVPVLTSNQPYFNAQPLLGGASPDPSTDYWVKGLEIPPGGEATIPLRLFSDAPSDAPKERWELSAAEEPNPHLKPDTFNQLSFSFDQPRGRDGDIRFLTIKRKPLPVGATLAPLRVAVISTLGSAQNVWWVSVGAPAQSSGTPPLPTPCGEARHAPMPQILSHGAPILSAPRVVPIFFPSDPGAPQVEAFLAKLGASTYFADVTREYGVGALTVAPAITASDPAPAQAVDTDISTWLASRVHDPSFPAPDANTLYALFYPATTTLLETNYLGATYPACGNGGAFNGVLTGPSGGLTPYVVVARCPDVPGGLSGIDQLTTATTAGFVSGATDPGFQGFSDPDFEASGWASVVGYEFSSMCIGQPDAYARPADLGYLVPRVWSNASAAAGRDPCAPAVAHARYFNAAPALGATESFPDFFTKGVTIEPGGKVTIPLRLFSDLRGDAWTLSAVENFIPSQPLDPYNVLSFSFDNATGNNGDERHLTVSRAATPDGSVAPFLAFAIVSTHGTESHLWIVAVGH